MKNELKTKTDLTNDVYASAKKGVYKPLSVSRLPKGSLVEVNEDDYKTFMAQPSTKMAKANGVVIKKIKSR